MKSIRRFFVLLLAVLMLIGMALPVCAEELAPGDETIVEETTMETPSKEETTPDAEPSTEEDPSTEEEASTEEPSSEETSVPAPEVQAASLLPEDEPIALDGDSTVFELTKSSLSTLSGSVNGRTVYYLGKNSYKYILKEDITLDKPMYLYATATLDLNGHKLSYSGTGCAITTAHILTLTNSGSTSTAIVTTESTSATVINIDKSQLSISNCSVVGNVTNSGDIYCSNDAQFKGFSNGTTATVTNTGFINTGSFASGCKVINNKIGDNSGYILDGSFAGPVESNGIIEKGTFTGSVESTGTIESGTFSGAVTNGGTIESGTFSGAVSVTSTGTIEDGSFTGTVYNNGYLTGGTYSNTVTNGASITGGTFSKKVTNGGSITGGSFADTVENSTGTINGGTYSAAVTNMQRGTLQSGTFSAAVTNDGTIKGGTFSSTVMNRKTIENGTFNGTVENHETITGGTFNNDVTNLNTITGGTFNKPVNSRQKGSITGGTFNSTVNNGGSITGGSFYGGDPDTGITDNKYTVSFDPDGGTLNGQTTIPSQYFIGSSGGPAKNPGTPSKLGYTFDGWYNGDAKYGFTETVSASITLKATWKPSDGPTFIGLETGGKYCSSVDFSVLDHSGSSVTVTASPGTLTDKGSNTYCLSSSSQQNITVTATNAKGNTTSVTVTLYAAHTGSASCTVSAPCANCGEMYYIPHTLTRVPAKANTSSEAGNREHWKCSVCSKCFADETGKTELDSITTALPKLISLTQDNIDNYLHLVTDSWTLSAGSRVDVSYYYRLDTDIDISEKRLIEFSQIDCTLDLNGHTLRLNELSIGDKRLILTDSSTAGTGCLQGRIGIYNATLYAAGGRIVSETGFSSIKGNLQALPGSTKTTVFDTQVRIFASGRVSTGTFCKPVENGGTITGGIFHGYVSRYTDAGTITGGVFYGGVADGMIGSDATVHTVSFDSKGGSGSIPAQLFVNTDTAPALKPAAPTRSGYTFDGWYKSGESAPYDFSAPVTGSFTLEAHWQSRGYTITYETNGGTLPESYPTSYATGSTISLPKPTKTGYTFEGWYESANFSSDKLTAIAPTEARNITLYANWTPTGDGKPASIGSQSYDTLADALTAAKNGDQIMLKANANPAESVTVGKEVILVNPGFTGYTINTAEGYVMTTSTVGSITIYSFRYTDETPAEPPVAMIVDVEYSSVAAALIAATSGQTVTVLADASEGSLIVKAGITLDLNGHDLTANALVALTGAQVKNSGTTGGLLKVTKGNVKLDPNNPQTTLWLADKGGYQLVSVTHHMDFPSKSESRFVARSYPQFDTAIETLLTTGNASDKGLSVQMRIQWINSSGIVQSQTYQFTDTHVHKVYADILSFGLTVTGISNIQTMDVTTMIVSDTGVTLSSSAIRYDKADLD